METSKLSLDLSKQIYEMGFDMALTAPRFNPETKQIDYIVTLQTRIRPGRDMHIDYHTGNGWRDKQNNVIRPTVADVLQCLILDSDALQYDFEDWCSNLGYDNDSRKALTIYETCRTQSKKLKVLLDDKFEAIQTLLQDY